MSSDETNQQMLVSVSLLPGLERVDEGADTVVLASPPHMYRPRVTLPGISPALQQALAQLQQAPVRVPVLLGKVMQAEGPSGLARLSQILKRLSMSAMLCYTLDEDGVTDAVLRPLSVSFRFSENLIGASRRYVLSRFAVIRADRGRMLLECPLGYADVTLSSPRAAAAVHLLAEPRTPREVANLLSGWDEPGVTNLLNLLANLDAVAAISEDGMSVESTDATLAPWDFHDLLFHTRSRLGRHANPYGGTFAHEGKFPPLPAIKPPLSDTRIPLTKPDLEQLRREDPPFTEVLEQRTSLREHGDPPISLTQLGEFLYRTAHVKHFVPETGVSFRPHPAGGALHELEIYPVISCCTGLDAGLYHYNPFEHFLCKVADNSPSVRALLQIAGVTATMKVPPQVLLIITARFQRLQLKYQSMTYALMLKNLGALYQTMYLVATAMGLAPCALGGGHADMFAQATGLEYLAESSVGEFVLGSRGAGSPDRTKYELGAR